MSDEVITKEHIQKRIIDWVRRLDNLYSDISAWLVNMSGYSVKTAESIKMYEELMDKYGVKPIKLKTLTVLKDKKIILTVKPIGLWVVGANGRVDILTSKESYILLDMSEKFYIPVWTLFKHDKKRKGLTFGKEMFIEILKGDM